MISPGLRDIRCQLLMGKTIPTPLSAQVAGALQKIEIRHDDSECSGFQITFQGMKDGTFYNSDYALLKNPQLSLFNRIKILIHIHAKPQLLMDGIVTHAEINTQGSIITLTGEDISLALDREEKTISYPMQSDREIVSQIIARYSQFNLLAEVSTPRASSKPGKLENASLQHAITDWAYINALAKRHGYVFYIATGPDPKKNTAYWGPPIRAGIQPKLCVNLGPYSNTHDVRIYHDPLITKTFTGMVQDPKKNEFIKLNPPIASNIKPLAPQQTSDNRYRTKLKLTDTSGMSYQEVAALAQAKANMASSQVIKVTGSVDVARYGNVLQARSLIELCGVGNRYDGKYYVKQVVHELRPGHYQQNFTLMREN